MFSCEFCEIFIYRTPPDDCFLLFESVKTSQQFPGNFEYRLTFYWKRHYSICIPKNWNILIWFVCHSTEYLKLKRIDRWHFLGKRSVVILKIIYFSSKWFFKIFRSCQHFDWKKIFIVDVSVVIFVWATFLLAWTIVCVFKWCRSVFRTIWNIFQTWDGAFCGYLDKKLYLYGIRSSHTFEIPSISNKKPSISIKIPSISIKNLGFRSKY